MKARIKDIMYFLNQTQDEHMGAFAAQSAFFLFLSFFPLISIAITVPRFLPITEQEIIDMICNILPSRFESYVKDIVNEIYEGSSNSATIISIVVALWSSSKGLMAIRNGLNEVYRSRENRNYVIIRGISSFYTAILLILLVVLVPLNMFGTQIAKWILSRFPNFENVTLLIYGLRTSATFVLLFLLFWVLYTIVPTRRTKFREQVPGALFSAFTWVAITKIYSLYIDNYANRSYMYGSLTTVILLMFWLYFVIYMMFVGAQINEYTSQCKQRAMEYELNKYRNGEDDVWDDSDVEVNLDPKEITVPIRHDYASEIVQEEIDRGTEEDVKNYVKKKISEHEEAAVDKVVSIREAAKNRQQEATDYWRTLTKKQKSEFRAFEKKKAKAAHSIRYKSKRSDAHKNEKEHQAASGK